MAQHVGYWEYDREAPLSCTACHWSGRGAGNEELFDELLDVTCPQCDLMLLIVPHPTEQETRAAAEMGNLRAQEALPRYATSNERVRRFDQAKLKNGAQLPDIASARVEIDWDLEEADGEHWTVLRHGGTELWRELAFSEDIDRFSAVFSLLLERYGARFAGMQPTPGAEFFLFLDDISAPSTVRRLNESLEHPPGCSCSTCAAVRPSGVRPVRSDQQLEAIRNLFRISRYLPNAEVERTGDDFRVSYRGERGVVVVVTADAFELSLPTIEWNGQLPISSTRMWRRLDATSIDDASLQEFVRKGLAARRRQFRRCRYCLESFPIEHRHGDVCHVCAERHLGYVH